MMISYWVVRSPEFHNCKQHAAKGKIMVIETDASKLKGWFYHICSSDLFISGEWPADFSTVQAEQSTDHINCKELWAVLRLVIDQTEILCRWRSVFHVDNSAAEHYVNIRYGRLHSS